MQILATCGPYILERLDAHPYYIIAYGPQLGSRLHLTHTQISVVGLSGTGKFSYCIVIHFVTEIFSSWSLWYRTTAGKTR